MDIFKRVIKKIIGWLKGDFPLWFTYWVTGVVPNIIFMLFMYMMIDKLDRGTIESYTVNIIYAVTIIVIIYIPLSLVAIAASAIRYKGLWVWKILAGVGILKGCVSYLQFVMIACTGLTGL